MTVESRCGIRCSSCDYRMSIPCDTCLSMEKPFWGEECPIKSCCESREHTHCGECEDFPCALLTEFSYDPKEGDDGERIRQCGEWQAATIKKELMKYVLSKPGTTQDYKEEWGWDRIQVGGKLYLSFAQMKDERPILTIKLRPEHGDLLRKQYPEKIIPGFYMNKEHWNTLYLDFPWSMEFLTSLVDEAYNLVFSALSKKKQREIIEE